MKIDLASELTASKLLTELTLSHSEEFLSFATHLLQNDQSPSLLFDVDHPRARIAHAKSLEAEYNCQFLFAVKACPLPQVLSMFAEHDIGFDVSNLVELRAVQRSTTLLGRDPQLVSASGPTIGEVSRVELPRLLINADCTSQLTELVVSASVNTTIGLRISTKPASYGHPANTTRFGFTPSDAQAVLGSDVGKKIACLHSHRSGPKHSDDVLSIAKTLSRLSTHNAGKIRYINLGGGSDRLTPEILVDVLKTLRAEVPRSIVLLFEFGSYWFAGSGVALATVINSKRLANNQLAVTVDISSDCHLRWSEPQFSFFIPPDGNKTVAHIFGPSCHEADYLGVAEVPTDHNGAPLVSPGDPVLVRNVDIYSVNWNTEFNGIPKANVYFVGLDQ